MPCYNPMSDMTEAEIEAIMIKSKLDMLSKELNKVTSMLCEVLSTVNTPVSNEIAEWHKEHQEFDKKRKRMENPFFKLKLERIKQIGIKTTKQEIDEFTDLLLEDLGEEK